METDEFKAVEMRVAAFTELTASEGRALYAGYIKRGLEAQKLRDALMMVLGSTLMEADGHDWTTCEQPSCVMARDALGVK